MENHELDRLRDEVASYDKKILQLIAQRLETTKAIGAIKQQSGLPIRDFRVEVKVLQRARAVAKESGLDERVAEEICEKLMAAAVQTQAELPIATTKNIQKNVHVLGGHGRMGSWLAHFFESLGHSISVGDPNPGPFSGSQKTLAQAASDCEVIVLASTLSATPTLLEELLDKIPSGASPLIFDIASLKTELIKPLRLAAQKGYRVTSLHPMFAPGATLLHGRAILVCDAGNRQATDEAKSLFAPTALGLYEVELDEHDKIMAIVLGLSHLTNLVFGRAVVRSGLPFELLGRIASTTFAKQIKTAAEVAEENPVLYHEIQYFNAASKAMQRSLEESLQDFIEASQEPNSDGFAKLMAEATHYLKS